MKIYFKRVPIEGGDSLIAYIIKPLHPRAVREDTGERYLARLKRVSRFPEKWCISVVYNFLDPYLEEDYRVLKRFREDLEPFFNCLKEVKTYLEQEYFLNHL